VLDVEHFYTDSVLTAARLGHNVKITLVNSQDDCGNVGLFGK